MCRHAHAHCTIGGAPRSDSVIICLSLALVASIHGPHCTNHLPSTTMDRSTEENPSGSFFFLLLSIKYLSVVDRKRKSKRPKYRSKNRFLRSSTSSDVVIFDTAACSQNENHVESWGAEEEQSDAAARNAELSSVCHPLVPPDTRWADKDARPQQRWVSAVVETSGCWLSI